MNVSEATTTLTPTATATRGPNTGFGTAVASCGDLDGDGRSDLVIGEPGYDFLFPPALDRGRVVFHSTKTGNYIADLWGSAAGDAYGTAVASCGDHDQDGLADFMVGAPGSDGAGADSGAVFVVSAATLANLLKTGGDAAGWRFGSSVAGMGDFDGDKVLDYLAGSPDGGATGRGIVRILAGGDSHVIFEWEGVAYSDGEHHALGEALASGAWNGDGLADMVWADPDWEREIGGVWETTGAVNIFVSCPASAENYGTVWSGRIGVPCFYALTKPWIGSEVEVMVENSFGADTIALLLLGTSSISVLTNKGGTLLVEADLISELFPLDAGGTALSAEIEYDNALCGLEFFAQVLEADPYASKNISFTPGLKLTIGIALP